MTTQPQPTARCQAICVPFTLHERFVTAPLIGFLAFELLPTDLASGTGGWFCSHEVFGFRRQVVEGERQGFSKFP